MTTYKKARKLDHLLIDAGDSQVMLAHFQSRAGGILCLPRTAFNSMTGRQILRKFNEYIDSLVEGVASELPPEIPDGEPKWSQMSCWGMPDKPVRKKPKVFKEIQTLPLKSVWLRGRSNDLDEREPAWQAIDLMAVALDAIVEELHQRTLPPPPPPPPEPPAPLPEVYEIPFGVARRRWRRSEKVPKNTDEFAAFFQRSGITVLDVTPGCINVPKWQASRINNILNGQNARPAGL
jgi:hypothetical protein